MGAVHRHDGAGAIARGGGGRGGSGRGSGRRRVGTLLGTPDAQHGGLDAEADWRTSEEGDGTGATHQGSGVGARQQRGRLVAAHQALRSGGQGTSSSRSNGGERGWPLACGTARSGPTLAPLPARGRFAGAAAVGGERRSRDGVGRAACICQVAAAAGDARRQDVPEGAIGQLPVHPGHGLG